MFLTQTFHTEVKNILGLLAKGINLAKWLEHTTSTQESLDRLSEHVHYFKNRFTASSGS